MGRPMGLHVLRAGIPLAVWARRPEATAELVAAGAHAAASPAELARTCDVLLVLLPDLPQLREVLQGADGLLAGVERPLVIVVSSTVSPTGVAALGAELSAQTDGRVRVVDAPVSGGEPGAVAGTLAIMVGGRPEDVDLALPVLRTCGTPVHLGPLGAGSVGKACNQMIVAATTTAIAEAAVLAERSGLDVGALLDIFQGGFAGSQLLAVKRDRYVNHDHSPSAPARFMVKDLGFALDQAASVHTGAPLTRMLREVYTDLTEKGYGDQDAAVVQAWIEDLPG